MLHSRSEILKDSLPHLAEEDKSSCISRAPAPSYMVQTTPESHLHTMQVTG